ncbi:hypothetical protein DSM112329_03009 [Paraconexibacter sp. AEG42_29]|uniref:Glycoside hydrolase family 5 domain-containing protein n=1 Tax=Paraconexibacter sp. AEG42_29 TaxID=2997339 RepID=A0AAU7AWY6_9ACTN
MSSRGRLLRRLGCRAHAPILALLVLCVAAPAAQAVRPGPPSPTLSSSPRLEQRGVAIDISFFEPASAELADVDAAAAMGANSVRVALDWAGLEPLRRGEYAGWYLSRVDALVSRAAARGVKVLLTPLRTPCWAAVPPADGSSLCAAAAGGQAAAVTPPADPATYGQFAAFLARRYGSRLAGIEVWNEPNLTSFWSAPDAALAYARLLKAAYPLIKRAAPATPVLAGALAGGDAAFLQRLYDAGINGFYDVLSVHPYNDGRDPEALIDARWASATFLQGLRAIRAARDARGDRTPVWLSELGWNTSTLRGSLWLDGVSPDQQADYLVRSLAMLQTATWGIDIASGVFVYRLRDIGVDADDPQHNYGLTGFDGTPKPALAAVRTAYAAAARR